MTLKLAMRWMTAIAVTLLVATAVGQEASTVNNGQQTPPLTKAEAGGLSKTEPQAATLKTEAASEVSLYSMDRTGALADLARATAKSVTVFESTNRSGGGAIWKTLHQSMPRGRTTM